MGATHVKIGLREGNRTASLGLRLRLWWNWQTRYFEVVVGQPVQVQVLLSAPSLPHLIFKVCFILLRNDFFFNFSGPLPGRYLSLIHISEPTRQAEISYAVFCLKKK